MNNPFDKENFSESIEIIIFHFAVIGFSVTIKFFYALLV